MRISKFKRGILFLVSSLFVSALFAGPYPGTIKDHGHSGPGDGGTIANLSLTTAITVPQIKSATTLDTVAISSPTVQLTTGTAVGLNIDGLQISTGEVQGLLAVNRGPIGMFNNRVSNGDMFLDHQNNGTQIGSYTSPVTTQTVDGWLFSLSTGAAGTNTSVNVGQSANGGKLNSTIFADSLILSVNTAANPGPTQMCEFRTIIPGSQIKDFGYGAANASSTTISFLINHTVAGTYGGSLCNAGLTRCYVFQYAAAAAGTWEKKTISFPGDTSGTWSTTDVSTGMALRFDCGSGTNYEGTANTWSASNINRVSTNVKAVGNGGAILRLTGVQLEKGATATQFEMRPSRMESLLLPQGSVGSFEETISSAASANGILAAATNVYFDVSTMTLTSGTWLISVNACAILNGATLTDWRFGISNVSGNSATGMTFGDNLFSTPSLPTAASDSCLSIASYKITQATTIDWFLKQRFTFSAGTPKAYGRISAMRVAP